MKVSEGDILKGVICMKCGTVGMKMYRLRWQCVTCDYRSRDAHENTLKDYFLLIGPTITNQNFRNFTSLKSGSTAKDMLNKASSKVTGNTKSRQYQLSYNFDSEDFNYLSKLNTIKSKLKNELQ